MPLPTALVVKNGSITLDRSSGGDAAPGVLDGQHDIVAGRQIVGRRRARRGSRRDSVMVPPGGHGVARIEDEVHQRKLELAGIDMDGPHAAVDPPLEPDQAAQDRRHQARHRVSASVGQRARRPGASCWRREKASIRLTSSAPCLAAWRVISRICAARLGRARARRSSSAEAAQDRGKQVVEVMGEAAGQLADRVDPLRLHQRLFELPPLGDVEQRAEDRRRAPSLDRATTPWSRKFR